MTLIEELEGGLALLGTIIAGVFRTGQLASRIETNTKDIHDVKVDVKADLTRIDNKVDELKTILLQAAIDRNRKS